MSKLTPVDFVLHFGSRFLHLQASNNSFLKVDTRRRATHDYLQQLFASQNKPYRLELIDIMNCWCKLRCDNINTLKYLKRYSIFILQDKCVPHSLKG